MSTEKERYHAVSVKIALSNEKNGNYIFSNVSSVSLDVTPCSPVGQRYDTPRVTTARRNALI
jgi:hypothetical protein